nr:phosphoenolpyruvate carboxykinase domain-containing protein [Streptomyces sp. DSM 41633]
TPIGILPAKGALDTEGLDLSEADLDFLLTVDKEVWREEAALVPEHLNTFGDHTPKELWDEHRKLVERLG